MITNIIKLLQTKNMEALTGIKIEIWDLLIGISIFWLCVGIYYLSMELEANKPRK